MKTWFEYFEEIGGEKYPISKAAFYKKGFVKAKSVCTSKINSLEKKLELLQAKIDYLENNKKVKSNENP